MIEFHLMRKPKNVLTYRFPFNDRIPSNEKTKKLKHMDFHLMIEFYLMRKPKNLNIFRVSHKKGIDRKLIFGAAQGFNSQFLILFGFSISVSFVWCII